MLNVWISGDMVTLWYRRIGINFQLSMLTVDLLNIIYHIYIELLTVDIRHPFWGQPFGATIFTPAKQWCPLNFKIFKHSNEQNTKKYEIILPDSRSICLTNKHSFLSLLVDNNHQQRICILKQLLDGTVSRTSKSCRQLRIVQLRSPWRK